ncbi:Na-Ca exchanger/integrin-beta4 [Candidatus Sulfopaludibacter sp. SbA4]|nr:Na-Ca exchanger/integrin-beta4 [Candidatus Sulfopaludibacter sp. SbA4]
MRTYIGRGLALAVLVGGALLLDAAMRSFEESVPLETVSETTANVSVGDLNGDGFLDIVLAKGRHWPLPDVVLLGEGMGHFKPGPPLPNRPDRSYSAPLADLNGDGSLDMVISNDAPDPKVVLLNDGKGRFTLAGTFGEPKWPTRNVVLADLNGDKSPDIAVANRPGPSYVCFNDGKAHFQCKPLGPETSATILAGDIDGDGSEDVVVACRDDCQSVVYLNDGKGNFPRKVPFGPRKSSTRALAVADFDGDGHLDIAACHEGEGLYIYFNDGKGGFGAGMQIAGRDALPYSMTAADLNRDGKPEIIVGYVGAPGAIYFNDGTGRKYTRVPFGDSHGAMYGLAAADLDGDGFPDIVAARSGAPSLIFFSRPVRK